MQQFLIQSNTQSDALYVASCVETFCLCLLFFRLPEMEVCANREQQFG